MNKKSGRFLFRPNLQADDTYQYFELFQIFIPKRIAFFNESGCYC